MDGSCGEYSSRRVWSIGDRILFLLFATFWKEGSAQRSLIHQIARTPEVLLDCGEGKVFSLAADTLKLLQVVVLLVFILAALTIFWVLFIWQICANPTF